MVRILKMKHALSNLENQIVEVNGGGQNSEARPCLYQTISTIKFTGQIYLPVLFMVTKINLYFLWSEKICTTN